MTDNLYFFFNRIHKASIVSHHIHLTSISLITFFVKKIGYLWPPYGTGQEILFLLYGFFIFFFYFFAYTQPSLIGGLPYFHTWCGLSANLRCRSETCCTRLDENTGCKNRQKFATCAVCTIWQLCRALSSIKARIDNWKKLVKQQYLHHMSS